MEDRALGSVFNDWEGEGDVVARAVPREDVCFRVVQGDEVGRAEFIDPLHHIAEAWSGGGQKDSVVCIGLVSNGEQGVAGATV